MILSKTEMSQHRAKVTEDEDESMVIMMGHSQCLIRSGASSHMTPKREYSTKYRSFSTPEKVALGGGRVVETVVVGTIQLNMFKVSNSKSSDV